MYGWIWRQVPGGTAVRAGTLATLALMAVAVLWFVVFPWMASHLPIDGSTLDG
jgi:hypothetical protein